MQRQLLERLSQPVQNFARDVQDRSGLEIVAFPSISLNNRGHTGKGYLEVEISADWIQLFAPANGYFPDGGVRHEVLHVHRFLVEGVPKLSEMDDGHRDRNASAMLTALDNAIEHLVIVPAELRAHPERIEHWEAVIGRVCKELPFVPAGERRVAACLHWAFMRHVLPGSHQLEALKGFLIQHGLLGMADRFTDQLLSAAADKQEMVRLLFLALPEIPKDRAILEYVTAPAAMRQRSIP